MINGAQLGQQGGHGDAVAYALGALDEIARARFEAHAATCPECLRDVQAFRPVADRLALSVPQVEPPPHLRTSLMAQAALLKSSVGAAAVAPPVRAQPAAALRLRPWWQLGQRLSGIVAAAALVVAITGTGYAFAIRQEMQQTSQSAAVLTETLSMMYQPGMSWRTLSAMEGSPQAKGRVLLNPDGMQAVVLAYDLPKLGKNESYQCWLNNPEEERRVNGGVFKVDGQGRGNLIVRAPDLLNRFKSIGVTREPLRGSPGPTGPRMLSGQL